jgi:hypothetical protein
MSFFLKSLEFTCGYNLSSRYSEQKAVAFQPEEITSEKWPDHPVELWKIM